MNIRLQTVQWAYCSCGPTLPGSVLDWSSTLQSFGSDKNNTAEFREWQKQKWSERCHNDRQNCIVAVKKQVLPHFLVIKKCMQNYISNSRGNPSIMEKNVAYCFISASSLSFLFSFFFTVNDK